MAIRMFDCGFGDSFLLHYNEKHNPLLVDFGVYLKSKRGGKIRAYENVVRTVNAIKQKDFMLTHFHGDHFSGMLYWKRNWAKLYPNRNFDNIIIPGVNSPAMIKVLLFLSLRYARTRVYFVEFLDWYCRSGFRGLHLVSRGDRYNDLEILWPDRGTMEDMAQEYLRRLSEDEELTNLVAPLLNQAQNVLVLINALTENGADSYQYAIQVIADVKRIRKTILDSMSDDDKEKYDRIVKELNMGNECSIVFQYKESEPVMKKRKCLFTGDVTQNAWDIIEGCTTPVLYDKFDVIKLPHHGTEAHYHDFSARLNTNCRFLIPNGSITDPSLYTYNNYRISTVPTTVAYDNATVSSWGRGTLDTIINRDRSEVI